MYDQKQVNFRKQMYGLLPFVLPDWRPQPSGRLEQIVFLINFIFYYYKLEKPKGSQLLNHAYSDEETFDLTKNGPASLECFLNLLDLSLVLIW